MSNHNKSKHDIVSMFFIIAIFVCVGALIFSVISFVYNSYQLSKDISGTNMTIKSDLNIIINSLSEKEIDTNDLLSQIDSTNEKVSKTIEQLQKLQEIEYAAVSHNILTFLYTFLSSVLIGIGTYYVNQCVKYTKAIKSSKKQISKNQKEVSRLKKFIEEQNKRTIELKDDVTKETAKTKEIKAIIENQQFTTSELIENIKKQNIKTIDLSFYNYYQSIVSLIDGISIVLSNESELSKKQGALCDYLPRLNSAIQSCYIFSNSINDDEMTSLKESNGKKILFDLNIIIDRVESLQTDVSSLITMNSKNMMLNKILLIKKLYQA